MKCVLIFTPKVTCNKLLNYKNYSSENHLHEQ